MESHRHKICRPELATPQLQNSEQEILILKVESIEPEQKLPNN
jgi:hypothetical protein